jgi:hypothetical protein
MVHDSYSGWRARNRHAAAPRFNDAFSTLLQRNLEHRFEYVARSALIYRNRCGNEIRSSEYFMLRYFE